MSTFLGYPFSTLNQSDFEAFLLDQCTKSPFQIITTLNPEIMVQAHHDPDLETRLQQTLCIADGVGIRLAHRLTRSNQPPLPKITGIDLTKSLFGQPAPTFFLVGTSEDLIQKCVEEIKKHNPLTQIIGYHHGFLTQESESHLLNTIKVLQPDFVLVGMGFPKQHLFLEKVSQTLSKGIGIGVGGTFDHLAGHFRLAPTLIRKIGLEWLYRALTDPSRLKRLSFIPQFLKMIWR